MASQYSAPRPSTIPSSCANSADNCRLPSMRPLISAVRRPITYAKSDCVQSRLSSSSLMCLLTGNTLGVSFRSSMPAILGLPGYGCQGKNIKIVQNAYFLLICYWHPCVEYREELAALLSEPKAKKRGPYNKKAA